MKNFKKNGGFTLVELIVVIAILAILAAVAIPAYSGYIDKTNMTLDQTLISDVKQAIELGYYSGDITEGGFVVIGGEGTTPSVSEGTISSSQYETALKTVFGNMSSLTLKYSGWNSEYSGSSFSGNEVKLMGKVESLTDVLGTTIANTPTLVGQNFQNYMSGQLNFSAEDMGDPQKAADAAVLYVANGTANLSPEKQKEFELAVKNSNGNFQDMMDGLIPVYDGSPVMAAAATYAMMTAYLQYEDKLAGNTDRMDALLTIDGSMITTGTPEELFNALLQSYGPAAELVETDANGNPVNLEKYLKNEATKDAAAFLDVMNTVNNAKNQIQPNLGKNNCFSTGNIQKLFTAYGEGSVIIMAEIQEDGTIEVKPMADKN